jgi:hypothetical protein
MSHNPHRGEITALLDDVPHTLVLTLGALAELESAFGDDDMLALAERFGSGRISARDATRVIAAGLRGAGHVVDDEQVARMKTDGGAAGYIGIVAKLLAATFGGPAAAVAVGAVTDAITRADAAPAPVSGPQGPTQIEATARPRPFPGPR